VIDPSSLVGCVHFRLSFACETATRSVATSGIFQRSEVWPPSFPLRAHSIGRRSSEKLTGENHIAAKGDGDRNISLTTTNEGVVMNETEEEDRHFRGSQNHGSRLASLHYWHRILSPVGLGKPVWDEGLRGAFPICSHFGGVF
jgi:hypothetical protein